MSKKRRKPTWYVVRLGFLGVSELGNGFFGDAEAVVSGPFGSRNDAEDYCFDYLGLNVPYHFAVVTYTKAKRMKLVD